LHTDLIFGLETQSQNETRIVIWIESQVYSYMLYVEEKGQSAI